MSRDFHDMEMRFVYGETLGELIEHDPNVMCLEADLSKASGTNPAVAARHAANFLNVGVAEANMIGIAAGLASEGKVPFCASFSCFASRRVYDQITISVAYANMNVKIVGTAPGVTAGPNGGTHMCFQDLAIMRAMPNMHVYSPCDAMELRSVMRYMAASRQPSYLQLLRPKVGKIFDDGIRLRSRTGRHFARGPRRNAGFDRLHDPVHPAGGRRVVARGPVGGALALSVGQAAGCGNAGPVGPKNPRRRYGGESEHPRRPGGGRVRGVVGTVPDARDSSRHSGPLRRSGDRAVSV